MALSSAESYQITPTLLLYFSYAIRAEQGPFPTLPPSLNEGTYDHDATAQTLLLYFFHTIFAGQGPFPTLPPSPNEGFHEPCRTCADCLLQLLLYRTHN